MGTEPKRNYAGFRPRYLAEMVSHNAGGDKMISFESIQPMQIGLNDQALRGVEHITLFVLIVSLGITLVFGLISQAQKKREGD